MRLFSRQFSKWWLLLLLPMIVIGAPLLLLLLIVAGHAAGAVLGPPAIWDRPLGTPARAEFVGRYVEYKREWDHPKSGPDAVIELKSDGTVTVSDLPEDSITSVCNISGSGRWLGPSKDQALDDWHIGLIINSSNADANCGGSSLVIVGRSKPFGLYNILGDPDSGTGVWLRRQ